MADVFENPPNSVTPRVLLEAVVGPQSEEDWCNIRQLHRFMVRGQKVRDVGGKALADPPSKDLVGKPNVMDPNVAILRIAARAKEMNASALEAARDLVCETKSQRLIAKEMAAAAQSGKQEAAPEAAKDKGGAK